MAKRIILVGPTCAGKTYMRDKFREKGFDIDVSYASRQPRPSEVDGVDYNFIDKETFEAGIEANAFYEWVKYGENYYGTGSEEWNRSTVFIMETDGVSKIHRADRPDCLVIYVNTPFDTRLKRMRERGWPDEKMSERVRVDQAKFKDFNDYDLQISSE